MRRIERCPVHNVKLQWRATLMTNKEHIERFHCSKFPNCDFYVAIHTPSLIASLKTKRIKKRF